MASRLKRARDESTNDGPWGSFATQAPSWPVGPVSPTGSDMDEDVPLLD